MHRPVDAYSMKRMVIGIVSAIALLLGVSYGSLYFRTKERILRIEDLEGSIGHFAELAKAVGTSYERLEASRDVQLARQKLSLSNGTNLFLYRFNGEGVPYFYGYAGYDTGKQQIVKVVVDKLW